jgi:hypothetical protein
MHKPGDSIPFALSESDQRVYEPRAVPLGKRCGCVCPGCRQPVYAKHCLSEKVAPHFAHAPGSNCATGFETALHLAAKQLIAARGVLMFPALSATISVTDAVGRVYKKPAVLVTAGQRILSNVVLEEAFGEIRPDVRVVAEDLGVVLVEVAVTHFVDERKLLQIKQQEVAAIEIDLSMLRDATFAALETALFDDPSRTSWLYHPRIVGAEADFRASIKERLDAAEVSAKYIAYSNAQMADFQRRHWLAEQEREADQRKVEAAQDKLETELETERTAAAEEALRQQRHETLKKASAFRARPEDHKKLILLHRLGLSELPVFLGADVRGAMSFGVVDPLVWQTTLFGGLIHKQAAEGKRGIATTFTRAWMRYRFQIPQRLSQDANDAIQEYLMRLSAAGALIPRKNAFFSIAVADLASFEALVAIRKDGGFDPSRFQWAPQDSWPRAIQVCTLTEAMIPNKHKVQEWIDLARTLRKHAWRPPLEICQWASRIGGSQEAVADYLIRTGFLRLTPPAAT